MTTLSCKVVTRALSLRFCGENFNSGDFFLAIFSPVALQVRGWLHVRFSPRAGDATKFEKIASPAQAKNRSCGCGFTAQPINVTVCGSCFAGNQLNLDIERQFGVKSLLKTVGFMTSNRSWNVINLQHLQSLF